MFTAVSKLYSALAKKHANADALSHCPCSQCERDELQSSMWSWHSLVRTPYQTWRMLQTDDPTNGPALRTMEKGTSRTKCDCSEIRRPVHLSDGLEEGVPKTDVKGQSSLTLFVVAQLL